MTSELLLLAGKLLPVVAEASGRAAETCGTRLLMEYDGVSAIGWRLIEQFQD